ncbi:prepilin-type N-terminal cleavage/methylation domain-containing protein [Pelagibacteraceae bacterium]|nr:prepilin-type N-terminal cleavage/methylation domain-containing protein [Pelagibacteraceae bacterium]
MPKKIVKGFTLIELLVVVAIIGILSAIGVVAYSKYTSIAQISVIKAQNDKIYNFIKTETAIQCVNYSNTLSLSYIQNGTKKTRTSVCNSSHPDYNGAWDVVSKMRHTFSMYFSFNNEFMLNFKNVIPSTYPYGWAGGCSISGYSPIKLGQNPGQTCLHYESHGSRAVSKNQCNNRGYDAWLTIVSVLPDETLYINCAGKTW